jgi:hypothetical protein
MGVEQHRPDLLGNFADIYLGSFVDGRAYIRKALGDKDGGYTLDQANRAIFLMQRFISVANRIGLPIADNYGFSVEISVFNQSRFTVHHTQQFLGRDVEVIIKNDENPIPAISGYFDCFQTVAASSFEIALDVHTANFCVDSAGTVRYIDLMPPRQTLEDGTKLATFPEPTRPLNPFFVDRIFSLEGQLPDIYSKVLRALAYNKHFNDPNIPHLIRDLLKEKFGEEFVSRMLVELDTFKKETYMDIRDVNNIRILAVEQFFAGGLSISTLEHIYSLTHFSPHGGQPSLNALQEAVQVMQT